MPNLGFINTEMSKYGSIEQGGGKTRNKDKRDTRPTKTKQTDTCLDNYYFLTNELIHPGTISVGVRWTEKHEKN